MPRPARTSRRNDSSSSKTPRASAPASFPRPPGIRIQKALAAAGIDSRRHCEELVLEGRVRVNGVVIDSLPAWVDPPHDTVEVDGKPIRKPPRTRSRTSSNRNSTSSRSPDPRNFVYVMLNKPRRVLCTNTDDPAGRGRALDLVDHPLRPRLFCVGRLDAEATGLLLLTNDGDLAHQLTHPRFGIHKTYELVLRGSLDPDDIASLERAAKIRLKLMKRDRDHTRLLMQSPAGRDPKIRRTLAALGCRVHRLRRISLGPLRLKGLAVGEWRDLSTVELRSLRSAVRDNSAHSAPHAG